MTSRRGFSLIEVIIANAILAGLIIMVMITIVATSRPTSDATARSFMVSQGNSAMNSLEFELNAGFLDLTQDVNDFCLGDTVAVVSTGLSFTINDAGGTGSSSVRDYDLSIGGELFSGRAIRFQPVTGFSVNDYENNTGLNGPVVGSEVIFAFVEDSGDPENGADDDGDGLIDEMRLVRGEGALVVELLADIPRGTSGSPSAAPEAPFFELTPPADIRMVFEIRRRVDYDAQTFQNVFAQVEFERKVNIRNNNQ